MASNKATAVVDYNSDLVRQGWMLEGLLQANSMSFTAPYTGGSFNSIVYQEVNTNAKDGHTVVFDFDGNLTGRAVKGKQTATGTGETKKKFSDKLTVDRYRWVVDNGDKFDGVNIGDLSITEHADSRAKLADLWIRIKDQAILDVAQQSATHRLILDKTFTFDQFLDVENVVKTGKGYVKMDSKNAADIRRPLKPFMLHNGSPVWLFVVDNTMKNMFLKTTGAQSVFAGGDVRGNENRLFKGIIGKMGNFLFVEADTFFGTTNNTAKTGDFVDEYGYLQFDKTEIEISGLRQYTGDDNAFVPKSWTGESVAAPGAKTFSRGLILGAGAVQFGMGKLPDYKWQESNDFGITSESCMEAWIGAKATILNPESGDYSYAKMGGISHGIVAVDIQVD